MSSELTHLKRSNSICTEWYGTDPLVRIGLHVLYGCISDLNLGSCHKTAPCRLAWRLLIASVLRQDGASTRRQNCRLRQDCLYM